MWSLGLAALLAPALPQAIHVAPDADLFARDSIVSHAADVASVPSELVLSSVLLGSLVAIHVDGANGVDDWFGSSRSGRHRLNRSVARAFGSLELSAGVAAGLVLAGVALHDPGVVRIGTRTLENLAVAGLLSSAGKFTVGRARPGGGRESDDFRPFRTSSDWWSFPSGHATTAFVLAHVLSAELGPRWSWSPYALYSLAGWAALSRVLDGRHWPTDIVAGAALGVLADGLADRVLGRETGLPRIVPMTWTVPDGSLALGYRVAVR